MASIQVSFVLNFDEETGETESDANSVLKDQIRDHIRAVGMYYDGMSISAGVLTSSLTGTENL